MNEGVKEQAVLAKAEEKGAQVQEQLSDKELNFRRLEAAFTIVGSRDAVCSDSEF